MNNQFVWSNMAKITMPNGIEITLDIKEVVALIKEYPATPSIVNVVKADTPALSSILKSPSREEATKSSDADFPTIEDLIKSIEDRGRPFSFNTAKELIARFNTHPRQDPYRYNKLHASFDYVKELMSKKYGGHWIEEKERIDGRVTKRFKLIEGNR
jgi:hypothetical protein